MDRLFGKGQAEWQERFLFKVQPAASGAVWRWADGGIPMEVFRSVIETNVFANLERTQGLARQMVQRGSGRIVWT